MPCPYNMILGRDTALPCPLYHLACLHSTFLPRPNPVNFPRLRQTVVGGANYGRQVLVAHPKVIFAGIFADRSPAAIPQSDGAKHPSRR